MRNSISSKNLELINKGKTLKCFALKLRVYPNKDSLTLGIDTKKVFNKSIDYSILIEFPLTKRQFNQIEKYLILIFNKKTEESKDWFKNASTYYGGKWQSF